MNALTSPQATFRTGITQVSERSNGNGRRPTPSAPSGSELIGMGVAIAVALIVPLLLGVGVDALAHTGPIGAVVGLFLGIAAACAVAIGRFRRYL
jgi:F0F1-type ATP synthase assembly protein I